MGNAKRGASDIRTRLAFAIRKQNYSDFFGTDLDAHLKEKGIRLVIIVGVATNICVMHTAS